MAEIASGGADAEVLQRANDEGRLSLTEDKDLGELVFRAETVAPGLVLLRIDPEKHLLRWNRLEAAVAHFGERLFGRCLVVEETRFRSRPLLKSMNQPMPNNILRSIVVMAHRAVVARI
jgi:predicted nuclease of predicted toxin-antitoxin system